MCHAPPRWETGAALLFDDHDMISLSIWPEVPA
jgi:hypothetical protein